MSPFDQSFCFLMADFDVLFFSTVKKDPFLPFLYLEKHTASRCPFSTDDGWPCDLLRALTPILFL